MENILKSDKREGSCHIIDGGKRSKTEKPVNYSTNMSIAPKCRIINEYMKVNSS